MHMPTRPTYITTPIYYVNDRPHIGHCYTTLIADAMARFERLRLGSPAGSSGDVFFLTGTDEHADKVVTTAQQHNLTPIAWADRNAAEFQKAFAFMQSSHDDFIRTTQDRHKTRVIEYVTALMKSGAIYKGSYEGWYDENQEEYLTETVAKEADYKSPVTGRPLVRRSEVCYFFRLSKYQDRLQQLFKDQPDFVSPPARRNEVLGRLRDGLNDVPISRPVTDDPATQFGIRVPGDPQHRIYVWIDALFNYLSVVDTDERRRFWPAQVHFIAKDILWFHAVIWPAMLMALRESDSSGPTVPVGSKSLVVNPTGTVGPPQGIAPRFGFVALPGKVYSHAYWVREGRKMSKSLGNFVTIEVLEAYAKQFGLDALRWYLLTQGPLHETDADFSHSKFVEVYNSDLANGIGNCASRVANMVEKYFEGKVPAPAPEKLAAIPGLTEPIVPQRAAPNIVAKALAAWQLADVGSASAQGIALVRVVDEFISATAPFKLAKDPANLPAVGAILAQCAEGVRIASILLSPAMPTKMAQLWESWGCVPAAGATLAQLCTFAGPHALKPGHTIRKGDALFMRADPAAPPPG